MGQNQQITAIANVVRREPDAEETLTEKNFVVNFLQTSMNNKTNDVVSKLKELGLA